MIPPRWGRGDPVYGAAAAFVRHVVQAYGQVGAGHFCCCHGAHLVRGERGPGQRWC